MIAMAKKREDRGKEKKQKGDHECNLDGDYISPIRSFPDITFENIRATLSHSRYVQILLSLTIIGLFLRFYNLGFNSLWLDEASTYTFSVMSIPDIWQATTSGEFNPPLFYWVEHGMLFFGNNETILRFIPALLGVLTIPLIYVVGREFVDRNVGIIAAAAFAFSPFLIFYSQEARAYSMMLFFAAFALVYYLKALKTNDIINWALFGVLSALAFWSHFYGFVIIAALVLYALFVQIQNIRKDVRNLKPLAVAVVLFTVICLPLVIVTVQLFAKRTASAPTFGIQGLGIISETFRQISGSSEVAMYMFLILFVVGIIQAFLLDKNKGIFLVLLTVLTFVISYFLSYRIPMVPRYLIFLSIVFFIGIAISYKPVYALIHNRGVVYGFIVLMVILSAPFLMTYYSGFAKDDWRGFSGIMKQTAQPGDFIVVIPSYIDQPFNYYYSNSTYGTIELHADNAKRLERIYAEKGNNTIYYIVTSDILSANPDGDAVAWLEENTKLVRQTNGITLLVSR
jgi:4-amino-4-deoxy-L-arabinose transferase-like glycosyltransferase